LYAALRKALPSLRGEAHDAAVAALEKADGQRPLGRRNGAVHS
jgi:hypothetical protein